MIRAGNAEEINTASHAYLSFTDFSRSIPVFNMLGKSVASKPPLLDFLYPVTISVHSSQPTFP